jgi:MoaA/NifB/PqqE/SkfB family radical SAM enzyme
MPASPRQVEMTIFKKPRLLLTWAFTRRKTTAAIDITNSCNLKCAHCYWWKEERPEELHDDAMAAFMKGLRAMGMTAAIIYGGEPMLRPRMCEAASKIFDHPLIFTNGTQGFIPINAEWIISLDGTRAAHDAIRGNGAYDCAVENLRKAPRRPVVHTTINSTNRHNLEEFLDELSGLPIKGVGFSFYTPHRTGGDDSLFIPVDERDTVLDELLRLRKKYWRIMGLTATMANQFRKNGEFSEWNSTEKCPVRKVCNCYNADGTQKPCTYGSNADCSRCGCASIPLYRAAIRHLDPLALFMIYRLVR